MIEKEDFFKKKTKYKGTIKKILEEIILSKRNSMCCALKTMHTYKLHDFQNPNQNSGYAKCVSSEK